MSLSPDDIAVLWQVGVHLVDLMKPGSFAIHILGPIFSQGFWLPSLSHVVELGQHLPLLIWIRLFSLDLGLLSC